MEHLSRVFSIMENHSLAVNNRRMTAKIGHLHQDKKTKTNQLIGAVHAEIPGQ